MTAIEEMAGMDVLCSDKTGTLTLNKLSVDKNLIEVISSEPCSTENSSNYSLTIGDTPRKKSKDSFCSLPHVFTQKQFQARYESCKLLFPNTFYEERVKEMKHLQLRNGTSKNS